MRVGPVAPGRDDPGIYIEVYRAPLNSRLHGSVAQGIEQRFPKPCVGSSILPGATKVVASEAEIMCNGYASLGRERHFSTIQCWRQSSMQSNGHERGHDAASDQQRDPLPVQSGTKHQPRDAWSENPRQRPHQTHG